MKNFKTKKSIGFLTLTILVTMVGCKDKAVEKEVIVMPASTTESTTIIEKEASPADTTNTTSITLDNKGLKVEAEKVDVKIGN
ncbi:hypothetical protein AAGV28_07335 [Flavobacterium sp. FZUC8N2.13]|uniref:Uncharacterized protein n=1 Tax=Flavobacterium zubiriense TaxID=3138075 RepID=A0ABV4TDP6_9FLAO